MKGLFGLNQRFKEAGPVNCFLSKITLAELKFGVANSQHPGKNKKALDAFLTGMQIIPVIQALDVYAKEKARLRKQGVPLDDFDLLIGATAIAYNLTLVTNNHKHF
jgi:tRNA(fMet)-specific endonuclease VapC